MSPEATDMFKSAIAELTPHMYTDREHAKKVKEEMGISSVYNSNRANWMCRWLLRGGK